jgi:hypothetical protein
MNASTIIGNIEGVNQNRMIASGGRLPKLNCQFINDKCAINGFPADHFVQSIKETAIADHYLLFAMLFMQLRGKLIPLTV